MRTGCGGREKKHTQANVAGLAARECDLVGAAGQRAGQAHRLLWRATAGERRAPPHLRRPTPPLPRRRAEDLWESGHPDCLAAVGRLGHRRHARRRPRMELDGGTRHARTCILSAQARTLLRPPACCHSHRRQTFDWKTIQALLLGLWADTCHGTDCRLRARSGTAAMLPYRLRMVQGLGA